MLNIHGLLAPGGRGLLLLAVLVLVVAVGQAKAQAQYTEGVLYSFCSAANCADGVGPEGLIFDSKGNLYGSTGSGTSQDSCPVGCTVIYELSPPAAVGGSWTERVLYPAGGGSLIFDSKGNLYGVGGGVANAGGAVFELSPPSSGSGTWTETVLYSFCSLANCADGYAPRSVIFDSKGNLYGVTQTGGYTSGTVCHDVDIGGCGVVFELSPPSSGSGPWTETVLYSFTGSSDGAEPLVGLILDSQGNLYGATSNGGNESDASICGESSGCGVVFELSPPSAGTSSWTETVLYTFGGGSEGGPGGASGLIFDPSGNLYGTTFYGGNTTYCGGLGCGVVFELSQPSSGSGPWTETVLYSFTDGNDGGQPASGVISDSKGNLYGTTTVYGGLGNGAAFELSPPSGASGAWTESVLYAFSQGSDGFVPDAGLIFDSTGNLYGTTTDGGNLTAACDYAGCGVVFELSPVRPATPATLSAIAH